MYDTGLPCSADREAKLLILGSMPGRRSLTENQYYAHPQNGFWPIMGALFDFDPGLVYEQRLARLRDNGIALWDVVRRCRRPGSMDHAIAMDSIEINDFASFFAEHRHIRAVFFNGRKAGELYRRLVIPRLPAQFRQLESHLLPSTSPAHAGMNRIQKLDRWKIVGHALENGRAHPYEA